MQIETDLKLAPSSKLIDAMFWSAATCHRFQSADMSAHSKAMPDSPAVAGLAFYVSWLLATASLRPDFHYLESVRIGAAGICG
jgi:hypothetical protein